MCLYFHVVSQYLTPGVLQESWRTKERKNSGHKNVVVYRHQDFYASGSAGSRDFTSARIFLTSEPLPWIFLIHYLGPRWFGVFLLPRRRWLRRRFRVLRHRINTTEQETSSDLWIFHKRAMQEDFTMEFMPVLGRWLIDGRLFTSSSDFEMLSIVQGRFITDESYPLPTTRI